MRKFTHLLSEILLNSRYITTPHQDPQSTLQIHNTSVTTTPISCHLWNQPYTLPRPHHTKDPHGKYFVILIQDKTQKDNGFILSVRSMDKFNQFASYATLLYQPISLPMPTYDPPPPPSFALSWGDGWCQLTNWVSVNQLPLQCPVEWVQSSSGLAGGHLVHQVTYSSQSPEQLDFTTRLY
jgi:hypothetical protein